MSFLGVDVGTSGCKAVAFDARGTPLAEASFEYAVQRPQPGWAELDSDAVAAATLAAIRLVARQCTADPIEALAISSQGEAFTTVAPDGRVLAPAMVSSDQRSEAQVAGWTRDGGVERLYQITGHTAHTVFTLFKLLWLRQERAELWRHRPRFLCFEDFLHLRLGLAPAISHSLAGRTMLFDVRRERWDETILAQVGLTADQLARPLPPGAEVGILPDGVAQSLGLGRGVRVVAGGHDQGCAALGAGAVAAGQAALTLGTVACITVALPWPVLEPPLCAANLCTYAHAAPGRFATLAYHLSGGNLLRWFRDQLGGLDVLRAHEEGADAYATLLATMPAEPTRLLCLPYFTPSGTPYFDGHTPGALLGLRLSTTRGEILRALLEGLGFELRLNLQILGRVGVPVTRVHAVGGGARSRVWLQLLADVLGCEVARPRTTEAGCLGAALLACHAQTGIASAKLLSQWVAIEETLAPHPSRADFYSRRFPAYEATYAALRGLADT